MQQEVLAKVRKLNWLLQESPKGNFSFTDICKVLRELTDSNVYIVDVNGKVLGVDLSVVEDSSLVEDPETGEFAFPKSYGIELMKLQSTTANLQHEELLKVFKDDEDTKEKYHTFIPILGGGKRWGTLILARYEPEYTDEDLVLAEVGATVVGLEIQRVKTLEQEEQIRQEEVVRMAISTLSYSEHEAVHKIFEELDGSEGILIASKVADRSRITRSVIVNALRKLESAGVIESKSLGMKGTHIKVLNDKFFEQLGLDK